MCKVQEYCKSVHVSPQGMCLTQVDSSANDFLFGANHFSPPVTASFLGLNIVSSFLSILSLVLLPPCRFLSVTLRICPAVLLMLAAEHPLHVQLWLCQYARPWQPATGSKHCVQPARCCAREVESEMRRHTMRPLTNSIRLHFEQLLSGGTLTFSQYANLSGTLFQFQGDVSSGLDTSTSSGLCRKVIDFHRDKIHWLVETAINVAIAVYDDDVHLYVNISEIHLISASKHFSQVFYCCCLRISISRLILFRFYSFQALRNHVTAAEVGRLT